MDGSPAYRHVLFDFDGVLCDSAALSLRLCQDLRRRDYPELPDMAEVADLDWICAGPPGTWLSRWLGIERANHFWQYHESLMFDRAGELGLFTPVAELLDTLP